MEEFAAGSIGFFVVIIITILVFLICREIVMWYWKINESISQRNRMIANQEKMISLLEEIKKSHDLQSKQSFMNNT